MALKNIIVTFTVFILLVSNLVNAQSTLKSEDDLKKSASELFENKKFVEAAPLYAQLLSLYPKEPDYNFKYGVCLLYSDPDKSKSLQYLAFATSKSSIDNRAYYYAGRAYHLNYQFTKALKNYNRFKSSASSAEKKEYEVDQQIEMVKNGNELLRSINRLDVISKEKVSKSDFFRIYELEGLNGKLVVKPDEFKSKYDRKNNESSIMFLPDNASEVYFSSYGKNGDNGQDIYKVIRLGNGNWSEAVNVGNSINTPYDEAFAFILPDGRTMYFASKGHNSIGGFDLFKSTYDESISNWTEPVNLNFPFSTVDDDVMFVTTSDQSIAYFASDRNSVSDQYYVYKVGTTLKTPDMFVIKGKFVAENIPNLKSAKITVVDTKTNETVGVYETDSKGNYVIEVEKAGGSYKFNVETTLDAPIHAGIVNIPKQEDFAVLGQELRLVGNKEDQKLVIKNIFDGSVNIADYGGGPIVSSDMLSRQANMSKNASETQIIADVRSLDVIENSDIKEPADATTTAKNEEVRTEEVKTIQKDEQASQNADQITSDLASIENQINKAKENASMSAALAYSEGYRKSNEALAFFKEAEKQNTLSTTSSGDAKETALQKAAEAKSRGEQLALESQLSLEYAGIFDQNDKDLGVQSSIINESSKSINSLIKTKDLDKANDELASLKTKVVVPNDKVTLITKEKSKITNNRIELEQEIANASNTNSSIDAQLKVLQDERASLEKALTETKNKKEIEKIESRISSITLDEEDLSFETKKNQQELSSKKEEVERLLFEERFITKLQNDFSTSQAMLSDIPANQKETLKENVNYFSSNNLLLIPSASEKSETITLDESAIKRQLASLPDDIVFEERIEQANAEPIITERNLQLAEANRDWSNTIDQRIRLNEQLKASADAGTQEDLENEITLLVKLKTKKEDEANQYQQLANELATDEEVNSTISAENIPEPAYNRGYRIYLKDVEKIKDYDSRLESQIAVYEDWNKSISTDIKVIEGRVAANGESETTNNQLEALKLQRANNSKAIEELKEEKLQLAANPDKQPSNTAASNTAANTASIEDRKEILSSSNLKTSEGLNYDATAGTEADSFSDLKYTDDVNYTAGSSQQFLATAEKEKNAAKELSEKYEIAKKTALSLPTVKERAEALAAADDIRLRSEKKQIEVSALYSDANRYQYVQQNNELNNYPKFSRQFESNNLDLADMLVVESESYLSQAQEIRASIKEEDRFTEKSVKLQNAYDLEILALKKQEEAKVALKQATVEYNNPTKKTVIPRRVEVAVDNDVSAPDGKNVLAAREVKESEQLRSEVATLEAEILTLEAQLKDSISPEERKTLTAEIVTLTEKRDAKETRAEILERRGEQLSKQLADLDAGREQRIEAISAEREERNLLRGAVQLNQLGVDAGTVDLTMEEFNSVKSNPTFIEYSGQINERNRLIKEANVLYEEMAVAELANDKPKVASLNNMIRIKSLLASQKEKEASRIIANVPNSEAIKMRKAAAIASGIATSSSNLEEAVLADNSDPKASNPSDVGSVTTDSGNDAPKSEDGNKTEITRKTSTYTGNINTPSTKTNTADNSVKLKATEEGIFSELSPNVSGYSKSNPIPIDVPLPNGIIYKVQVGAFRNPISQDLFKGFAPLMGESLPSGITRYTAGIFLDFNNADDAKKAIVALGYKDAFVVAFRDGKRISVSDAKVSNGNSSPTSAQVNEMAAKLSKPTTATSTTTSKIASAQGLPSEFAANNVESVKNVNDIKGVYFTVQVGVFSKPITKGELNISDLAVKVIKDKLYRYSSGVYDDPVKAFLYRDNIKKTVPDAFVIAYNNGTKISLEKALELLNK